MDHNALFVFDIETIPDIDVVKNLCHVSENSSVDQLRDQLKEYHLDITDGKNDFPRQLFHQVACVSFVSADIERFGGYERYHLQEIRSGGSISSDEHEIVNGLFRFLEKRKSRLISFNGRTFDLPVLKYRALKHSIDIGWLYKDGDKWNSYTSRYSTDWHCDLLDVLSDFGLSARIKLREVCAILDIPCKYDIDGSNVQSLYDKGMIGYIRNYCEIDAIITYIVYLRYAFISGRITKQSYKKSIEDLIVYIEKERLERSHLGEFLDKWRLLSNEVEN